MVRLDTAARDGESKSIPFRSTPVGSAKERHEKIG
jgi:hypothetical protein